MEHYNPTQVEQVISECQERLTKAAVGRVRLWLTSEAYADHVDEVMGLIAGRKWDVLEQSFGAVLPFGTGGRRGPRGVGPNRINARTIAESARGLVNWARQKRASRAGGSPLAGGTSGRSEQSETSHGRVVIAYDTRIASRELATVCAEVIAAAGMTALVFDDCRPTPELSFAVRYLRADAGIVISASHNPPTDNGFKAYGPDGGQIPPPLDAEVMRSVKRLSGMPIPRMPFEQALSVGRAQLIGSEVDAAYRTAVGAAAVARGANRADVRIVYTPLHGTGMHSVVPVLSNAGFSNLEVLGPQAEPNGEFPTVPGGKPNPEEPQALLMAGERADDTNAEIAIGTDPDADRLGCIAIRLRPEPTRKALSGNQIGTLLCTHVLSARSEQGLLRSDALVLTTTVTSPIIGKMGRAHGVGVIESLLVGFKYIACVLGEVADPDRVVFACEESHGYLAGHYTRDKDAACAALLIAEATARAKAADSDLWEQLDAIYVTYGYHADQMLSEELSPAGGKARIRRMTNGLRTHRPNSIGGYRVRRIIDRLSSTVYDPATGVVSPFEPIADPLDGSRLASLLPARDNLLLFELDGDDVLAGARLAIRPSGTEPKCKLYTSVWTDPDCDLVTVRRETDQRANALQEAFVALARGYADGRT